MLKLVAYVLNHPLNRDERFSALVRVFRWQVASRLLAGPVALPFVEGTQLFVERGMTGATGNWYCGLHEHEEMGFLLHYLRSDELFLDVGANIGSYSVLAGGAVGARVLAVEPIPETFQKLERNIVLNGLTDRVMVHCMGLSNESGELRFTPHMDTVNHVLAEGEPGPAISVPVAPMDKLVLESDVPAVIKIDVEGHEKAVLLGGARTLSDSRVAAVIMELNGSGERYGVADQELLAIMMSHGFKPYSYDPLTKSFDAWNEMKGNAIFLRNLEAVSSRVKLAKPYTLVNGSI